MAGLSNLLTDTQTTQTTLPAWFDTAQQSVVNGAMSANAQAPQLNQTVAQGAINQLQPGAQNPFTQAQGTLQQIASGAANPWITDTSGNVTPNTNTAMGGLFAAQNQQLKQLMPNTTAPAMAAGIGSGNFGSLRGQTAVNKAMGDAITTQNAQQLAAALQNQQYGVSAATNLGNVTNQYGQTATNLAGLEQNAPFKSTANLANILGGLNVPGTTTNQLVGSPLTQATQVGSALQGGLNGLTNLAKTPAGQNILSSMGLGGLFGIKPTTSTKPAGGSTSGGGFSSGLNQDLNPGSYQLADGGYMTINSDGTRTINAGDGSINTFDSEGNLLNSTNQQDQQDQQVIQDQENGSNSSTPAYDNFIQNNPVDQPSYDYGYVDQTYDPSTDSYIA